MIPLPPFTSAGLSAAMAQSASRRKMSKAAVEFWGNGPDVMVSTFYPGRGSRCGFVSRIVW